MNMKRTFFRIFTLLPALALTLGLTGCVSLARQDGGLESGDTLIGYFVTVLTEEEHSAARDLAETLAVDGGKNGGQLRLEANAIPAALDEEQFTVRCEAFTGYAMLYIADEEYGRSGHDPHFTEVNTNVHITSDESESVALRGTLYYDVTGIAADGSFRTFDREPTAADFGGQPFTAYQTVDDEGNLGWEGAAGERLTAALYAVYRTAEGECYLTTVGGTASMALGGTADGGSSALSVKNETASRDGSQSSTEALEIEARFQPSLPYELTRITQFDENHRAVAVKEFAVGDAPETLRWAENAAYMMAERTYTDDGGETHRTYDTIQRSDGFYLYPLWQGARVAQWMSITLAGQGQ